MRTMIKFDSDYFYLQVSNFHLFRQAELVINSLSPQYCASWYQLAQYWSLHRNRFLVAEHLPGKENNYGSRSGITTDEKLL